MMLTRRVRGALVVAALTALAGAGLTAVEATQAGATTPSASTAQSYAMQVFWQINRERNSHGIASLAGNNSLLVAAARHNAYMAKYNTLSHQLPGELSLGARITAAGYKWRAVGENIGVTQDWTLNGLLTLATMMYNDPAHRANILSTTYRNIGVSVYMDGAHHKAWLTEDFGAPL